MKKSTNKKFLIITPTFNRAHSLIDTVNSVINQTYKNWEYIIVDDCSTDNTLELIKPILAKHKNIHYISNSTNKGAYASRNKGLKYALDSNIDFDIFSIFDSDDFCEPDRYSRVSEYFKNDKLICLLPTAIRSDVRDLSFESYSDSETGFPEGTCFYSKIAFNILGFFNNVRMGGDTEYLSRCKKVCYLSAGKYTYDKMSISDPKYIAYKAPSNNNLTYSGQSFRSLYLNWFKGKHLKINSIKQAYNSYSETPLELNQCNKVILCIMPIYNREKYLHQSIESVTNQSYRHFKLVLVDDGSTDKSLEICKSYEHLENVTVLSNKKNMGCYYTRNHALYKFRNTDWDFFTIHDSDDTSSLDRFDKILKPLEDKNLLGLKTSYISVNEKGEPARLKEDPSKYDIYASEGIAIFPRKTFDLLGYYDNTRFSGDTEYWTRAEILCHSSKDYFLGQHTDILYKRVYHEENLCKKYDFHTTRPKYFKKFHQEIKDVLIPSGSLRREFSLNA